MEQDRKRPTKRGTTTVTRERPQTPASRPKSPRSQSGRPSQREAERKIRIAEQEQSRSTRQPEAGQSRSRRQPETERKHSARQPETRQKPSKSPAKDPEPEASLPRRGRKKKPHRVYNTNFAFKFLIMLAVVAVIFLSMLIFFKVKHIEVIPPEAAEGARSYYSADEIVEACGINIDENLLNISKPTVAARIHAALPYVNEIQIKKQLPGTVIISFTEFDVTYGIQDESGGWWLMSREGRIMEQATEQEVRGHLTVSGMPIQRPEAGDYFVPAATDGADMSEIAAKQTVVLELLPALEKMSYAKQIVSVDVSTSYDLILWYGTRYEVRLGTTKDLTYKLQYLQTLLENKDLQRRSGTIDLTFNEDEKAHFLEFR